MSPYPAFNGKTINKPGGGDGEIDRRAVLITQPTEAHFTGSVLYAHLCLWNCNRLFQLHARLDHSAVTIDVLLWVNLCKNHSSWKWCKKTYFSDFFFSIISHCSLQHCSNTDSALNYGGINRENKALVFVLILICGHKLCVMTIRKRSWVVEAEIRFLCRVAWVWSSVIWKDFGVKPPFLHTEKRSLVNAAFPLHASDWRNSTHLWYQVVLSVSFSTENSIPSV